MDKSKSKVDAIRYLKNLFPHLGFSWKITFHDDIETFVFNETEYCSKSKLLLDDKQVIMFKVNTDASIQKTEMCQEEIGLDWKRSPPQMEEETIAIWLSVKYRLPGWHLVDCPSKVGAFILTNQESFSPYYPIGILSVNSDRQDRLYLEEKRLKKWITNLSSISTDDATFLERKISKMIIHLKFQYNEVLKREDECKATLSMEQYKYRLLKEDNDRMRSGSAKNKTKRKSPVESSKVNGSKRARHGDKS